MNNNDTFLHFLMMIKKLNNELFWFAATLYGM